MGGVEYRRSCCLTTGLSVSEFLSRFWKLEEYNLRETYVTQFADGTAHKLYEWSAS